MVADLYDEYVYEEFDDILRSDDKERLLPLLTEFAHTLCLTVVESCALSHARKCLLTMIQGEGCIPPAHELYARQVVKFRAVSTPLAIVASHFGEAYDIIELLLKRGPLEHANIKCYMMLGYMQARCPLDHLLVSLSDKPHLHAWSIGDSLNKLIILLCQWKTNTYLRSARLLVPYTDEINNIAFSYVKEGNLLSLAALLLVARQNVFAPFDSGLTIRQCITDLVDALSSEGDLDLEGTRFLSMLLDACMLLDIFEIVGETLSLYSSSMQEYVPPDKVLIDVVNMLKKVGFILQPIDIDLRDCYRECPEIYNASMFKLSDLPSPEHKYRSPSSLTRVQGFGSTHYNYHYAGDCHILHKLKSGPMLNLSSSASMPRLLTTGAGHVNNNYSCASRKYLAYIAFRFKRGFKL